YCVSGIKANEKQLKEYVDYSVGLITAVNPHIGYERATEIATEAMMTNKSVRTLCLEHGILTEKKLDSILNPFEMTSPGISGSNLLKDGKRTQGPRLD